MARQLVMLLVAGTLLAACSSRATAPVSQAAVAPASASAQALVSCDDGGDGGVIIHGVCL